MAIHMVRYYSSAETDAFLIDSYIPIWLTNHLAWTEQGNTNEPPELVEFAGDDEADPVEAYAADWRFEWSESPELLLANLRGYADFYAPWYRMGYHVCDHDEADGDRSGCEWADEFNHGTVPDAIPSLAPPSA